MLERIYFAAAPYTDELEALKLAKPKHILVSYALWSGKDIERDLLQRIGYHPDSIILDSGAYTFHNACTDIGLYDIVEMYGFDEEETSYAFMASQVLYDCYALDRFSGNEEEELELPVFNNFVEFVHNNKTALTHVINMDTIGDADLSKTAYYVLCEMGLNPIPVFGFTDAWDILEDYVQTGARYIALGGSAKRNPKERIAWANAAAGRHPDIHFHLLGTMNKHIVQATRHNIYSLDGTAWNATFKARRYEGRSKVEQSCHNILTLETMAQVVGGDACLLYRNGNGQTVLAI